MQFVSLDTCQTGEDKNGAIRLPTQHVVNPG